MSRAPYLGLSVVCAAALNAVSVAAMARRLADAAPLIGDDLDAAVRWYGGLFLCLALTVVGLALLGLSLAGTWSLREGRSGVARTVAVLLLLGTVVVSWNAGATPWQAVCGATAVLCLPVLGYRSGSAGRGPLPVRQQGGAGAPLLVEQR